MTASNLGFRFQVLSGLKGLTIAVCFTVAVLFVLFMLAASVNLDPPETRYPVFAVLTVICLGIVPMGILGGAYIILRGMISEENRENRMIDLQNVVMAICVLLQNQVYIYSS
jgi:hypothetical protein